MTSENDSSSISSSTPSLIVDSTCMAWNSFLGEDRFEWRLACRQRSLSGVVGSSVVVAWALKKSTSSLMLLRVDVLCCVIMD